MSEGLGRRNLRPLDHALDITVWLTDNLSIGQGEGLPWRCNKKLMRRSHITIDDLPSTDEWTSGKEKQNASEYVQCI